MMRRPGRGQEDTWVPSGGRERTRVPGHGAECVWAGRGRGRGAGASADSEIGAGGWGPGRLVPLQEARFPAQTGKVAGDDGRGPGALWWRCGGGLHGLPGPPREEGARPPWGPAEGGRGCSGSTEGVPAAPRAPRFPRSSAPPLYGRAGREAGDGTGWRAAASLLLCLSPAGLSHAVTGLQSSSCRLV